MARVSALVAIIGLLALPGSAVATGSSTVAISEVFGGGGNAGAPYANDFVELRNLSAAPVSLSGWSVQYASASGASWSVTPLPAFTLGPGQFFLVQEASGGANGAALPTPDAMGTIALGATAGKIALVSSATALTGTCPPGAIDLVGYGTATCFEGTAAAPAPSNTLSDQRANRGLLDTDQNATDFQTAAPEPQNTASPSAVALSSFTAQRAGRVVLLRWRMATETGVLGYRLYREGIRLNDRLIVAGRGNYAWRVALSPVRHAYRLEAVRFDGRRRELGTVRA